MAWRSAISFTCHLCTRLIIPTCIVFFSGCSITKTLEDNEKLHLKNEVILMENEHSKKINKRIKSNLLKAARPNPNYGPANLQLNFYSLLGKPKKEKGFKKWLSKTIGEAPVIYDSERVERSRFRLQKTLLDNGFFNAEIEIDSVLKNQKARAQYIVQTGPLFYIRDLYYPEDTSSITGLISTSKNESLLVSGDRYLTEIINKERLRLTEIANDSGYLEVGKEDFLFYLDTIPEQQAMDIYVQLRPAENNSHYDVYQLGETWIYEDFSLAKSRGEVTEMEDTTSFQGLNIIRAEKTLLPKTLGRTVPQRAGDLYSKTLTSNALNRLLDLQVYQFVNLSYEKTDSTSRILDRHLYLTPGDMQTLSFEILANTNTRSGNFFGSGIALTYTHRNLFKGAERLEITASGEVKTEFTTETALINSLDAGIQAKLILPYFVLLNKKTTAFQNPQTHFGLSYIFDRRIEFYTLSSLSFSAGYTWVKGTHHRHQLTPISINRVNLLESTEKLDDLLLENPTLRASFEDVYIPSLLYTYSVTNREYGTINPYTFFKVTVEPSGNLAYISGLLQGGSPRDTFKVFGLPFSQFIKVDLDIRRYQPTERTNLVFRFFGGMGASYGNSSVMPYVKQYFSGGSTSIRAFRVRTVGPGSYFNADADPADNQFIDQTGEIKLEANVEYRFPLISYLKGAVFLDAGNIWLLRQGDDPRIGGAFNFNTFYKEIASGVGFGVRLDISSFVIRLDMAFPLSKPFLPEGERWVLAEVNFFNKAWRNENLIFNLAIGYPF